MMKNAFSPATALWPLFSMEASPSPLSSRAQPRDLQFCGLFLEMFFDRAQRSGGPCSSFPISDGTKDGSVVDYE